MSLAELRNSTPAKEETKQNAQKSAPKIKDVKLVNAKRASISAAAHRHVMIVSLDSAKEVFRPALKCRHAKTVSLVTAKEVLLSASML